MIWVDCSARFYDCCSHKRKNGETSFSLGVVAQCLVQDILASPIIRKCIPEIRQSGLALQRESLDIVHDECGCPAGEGPHVSCKDIVALPYALVDSRD